MQQLILADIAGPFYDLDLPFRNWSSLPFTQLDLAHPPYVDAARLDAAVMRAIAHLARLQAQGYTGIVLDNLAHLTGFEAAGGAIYPPGCPERLRAACYRAAFGRLFAAAEARGMAVFITTDMQWSTAPLRRYVGQLAADNPRLAEANRRALAELFAAFPQVRGIVVRVGEAGGAHNAGGYDGHMLYRSVAALRALIDTLLPVCAQYGRLLVVRTWSIGVGELGDLLWSPARYHAVFGGYSSPHLLASVKHGPADFFRLLPPNPTIGLAGPRQIIELQNRREYELFGMAPSGVAALHGAAIRHAAATGAAGVWAWNATGGWGGGTATLGPDGWNVWTELSSALTAALAQSPALDPAAFVRDWCAARLGGALGAAAAALYLDSEQLWERGWYMGPLVGAAALRGIRIPPLLWVWWMRPTAAPLCWAYLAAAVASPERALRDSRVAVAQAARHAAALARLAADGGPEAAFMAESARYFWDALAVAYAIRAVMLPAFAAAARGEVAGWRRAARGAAAARAGLRQHRETWDGRRDFPALELDEIDAFLASLERMPEVRWLQARAACEMVAHLRAGGRARTALYAGGTAGAVMVALALARLRRTPVGVAGALTPLLLAAPPVRRQALRAGLPWLNRRLFLLPSIFFETGPSLTEWA
jgi:hypothetical protein